MKNSLVDLNNILFGQLEKLSNDDLSDEELETEIKRGKAIESLGKTVIQTQNLALQVMKHQDEYGYDIEGSTIKMLGGKSED